MAQPDLSVNIGTLKLGNPVLTASGTFGYGAEYGRFVDLSEFGGIITKTLTVEPRAGNPPPRAAETASGMLNSIGLQNVGVEAFIQEKMPYLRKINTALIVNVGGETVEQFNQITERLADCEGIGALEVNMSCPNVSGGMDFSTDPSRAAGLISSLRKLTNLPLIAKLTPNITDITQIASSVQDAGADAISAINTVRGMGVDIKTRKPLLGAVMGGLSGPAIKPVAVAAVYQIANQVNIPIIGVGGIISGEDAIEFLVAGATADQVGTANFVEPNAGADVVEELNRWCTDSKILNINDLIRTIQIIP